MVSGARTKCGGMFHVKHPFLLSLSMRSTGFWVPVRFLGSAGALVDASASAPSALYLCAALSAVSAVACPVIKQ